VPDLQKPGRASVLWCQICLSSGRPAVVPANTVTSNFVRENAPQPLALPDGRLLRFCIPLLGQRTSTNHQPRRGEGAGGAARQATFARADRPRQGAAIRGPARASGCPTLLKQVRNRWLNEPTRLPDTPAQIPVRTARRIRPVAPRRAGESSYSISRNMVIRAKSVNFRFYRSRS
jgi:hypothetical protein